jgi:hypothetical protein
MAGENGRHQPKAPASKRARDVADCASLKAHNAHLLRRRQAIVAILRRPEAERLTVELLEKLIAEGRVDDAHATEIVERFRGLSPIWLAATGGNVLPSLPPPRLVSDQPATQHFLRFRVL